MIGNISDFTTCQHVWMAGMPHHKHGGYGITESCPAVVICQRCGIEKNHLIKDVSLLKKYMDYVLRVEDSTFAEYPTDLKRWDFSEEETRILLQISKEVHEEYNQMKEGMR